MDKQLLFNFKTELSKITIISKLNNPFEIVAPEIAKIAAKEFQEFITEESKKWKYDFAANKGKMFGILVVQQEDGAYSYIGTVSGKLPNNATCNKFIPSVFDASVGDFFINKGLTALSEIGNKIKSTHNPSEVTLLKEQRTQKSIALQQRLFENYNFLNLSGKKKNLLEIFKHSSHGNPPVAAGECVAPKLFQYAIKHQLKPIALAEFWWGNPIKNKEKEHAVFYPSCKNRCRPILEYMLEDSELFARSKQDIKSENETY
jgi:tRNA pseudouridine32 synthase/23S rRNA pseudouridine746 synthase|tara:strand:- start:265 stop:1044 length:780 start_codon:yes stop_codon:yes gene_type:complete